MLELIYAMHSQDGTKYSYKNKWKANGSKAHSVENNNIFTYMYLNKHDFFQKFTVQNQVSGYNPMCAAAGMIPFYYKFIVDLLL